MKSLLCVFISVLALGAFAQGTVTLNTASTANGINIRIFGPQTNDIALGLVGNRAEDTPAGTQVYAGALLTGSNFRAELWGAPGLNQP